MKYDLIIFDWDGTLMDSAGKIVSTMHQAADRVGVARRTDEQVKDIIGISLKPAIMQLFETNDEQLADRLVDEYKNVYLKLDQTTCPLFDGTIDVLNELKAAPARLAVATGKARRGLTRAWQQSNTGHFFDSSRCADEAESKPNPDMLVQLLEEMSVSVERALMIGDTEYDMRMAEAIGMDRVAVSYGVHSASRLSAHKPVAVIDDIRELLDAL